MIRLIFIFGWVVFGVCPQLTHRILVDYVWTKCIGCDYSEPYYSVGIYFSRPVNKTYHVWFYDEEDLGSNHVVECVSDHLNISCNVLEKYYRSDTFWYYCQLHENYAHMEIKFRKRLFPRQDMFGITIDPKPEMIFQVYGTFTNESMTGPLKYE